MASFSTMGRAVMGLAGRAPRSSASRRVIAAAPARRFLSEEAAKSSSSSSSSPPAKPPAATPAKKRGSSFLQRLGAFLTGAGLGCGIGYYHLATEIKESTAALEKAIAKNHSELSLRLDRLEK